MGAAPPTVYGVSHTVCFYPEEDEPQAYDGSMIAWTFGVPKAMRTGAGIYRLEFVRILTPEERQNPPAQVRAIEQIAADAQTPSPKGGIR